MAFSYNKDSGYFHLFFSSLLNKHRVANNLYSRLD